MEGEAQTMLRIVRLMCGRIFMLERAIELGTREFQKAFMTSVVKELVATGCEILS
jgi:hypothetical protein